MIHGPCIPNMYQSENFKKTETKELKVVVWKASLKVREQGRAIVIVAAVIVIVNIIVVINRLSFNTSPGSCWLSPPAPL